MKREGNLKIAFIQRHLPLYRLGFYKELSNLNTSFDFTLFCPKGEDYGMNIKTISPEQFLTATKNNPRFKWVDTKLTYYYKAEILWQSGIIMPLLRKQFDVLLMINKMSHLFYWLLILICKLRGIKLVFWSHGLQGKETGFKLFLKRWFLSLPDVNLIYAHYSKEILMREGFKEDTIKIVYNSLDFTEQDECYAEVLKQDKIKLKKNLIHNNYPVVIFLGRLEKRKRIDMLLKAASILYKRNVLINVIIAGEGAEYETLKLQTSDLGLNEYVHFLGRLEEPELVKYFYVSDLSVSPGNVGLNCIHSLNYGVPVITHNDMRYQFPEVEVLTENETGIFFRHDDVEDLADKIEYWLKTYPENNIGDKLRMIVKNKYSPQMQAQCVLDGISLLDNL